MCKASAETVMKSPVFKNHLGAMLCDSRALRVDAGQRKEPDRINERVDGGAPWARDLPGDGS
jgi:hypothetical protein